MNASPVRITPDSDLVLFVRGEEDFVVQFHVNSRTLSRESHYFAGMLSRDLWLESGKLDIDLGTGNAVGLDLMLRAIHDNLDSETLNVDISAMWHLVIACDYYGVDIHDERSNIVHLLRAWYFAWYKSFCERSNGLDLEICRMLLWPSFEFKAAKAFQFLSNELIYGEPNYIMDACPPGVATYRLHLPGRVTRKWACPLSAVSPSN